MLKSNKCQSILPVSELWGARLLLVRDSNSLGIEKEEPLGFGGSSGPGCAGVGYTDRN
jgi:hypothetical protein